MSSQQTAKRAAELLCQQDPLIRIPTRKEKSNLLVAFAQKNKVIYGNAFDVIRLAKDIDINDIAAEEIKMPRGKQTKGKCAHCGLEIAKGGVARHLSACNVWKELLKKAERKKGSIQKLYHLRVQAAGQLQFWLDVEMRGSSTLDQLDHYLREIWLDCCGHLSQFISGRRWGKEISMRRRIKDVLEPGIELTHIYDFGTSSETLIKAVGVREGKPVTSHPIALLVRNVMPESQCIECGLPAGWLCLECLYEENVWGPLCERHAKIHPHKEYDEPIALANSPRFGMCAYVGPAEPPYRMLYGSGEFQ